MEVERQKKYLKDLVKFSLELMFQLLLRNSTVS